MKHLKEKSKKYLSSGANFLASCVLICMTFPSENCVYSCAWKHNFFVHTSTSLAHVFLAKNSVWNLYCSGFAWDLQISPAHFWPAAWFFFVTIFFSCSHAWHVIWFFNSNMIHALPKIQFLLVFIYITFISLWGHGKKIDLGRWNKIIILMPYIYHLINITQFFFIK